MRLGKTEVTAYDAPLWPPVLATRGPGGESALHRHHAMHLILSLGGELRVRGAAERAWHRSAGVLTAPDVEHSIDARGGDVLLVFLEPESDVGLALQGVLTGAFRFVVEAERDALLEQAEPLSIMRENGVAWTARAVRVLGGQARPRPQTIHPRVRRLLKLLRTLPADADTSLEALAAEVGLSPGRLMHVFSESIGVPLRPYLSWLKLQRAAGAIASGRLLADAAALAGFADAAHMSRSFRKMLGVSPSALRPPS